jgi:hypothetical protein
MKDSKYPKEFLQNHSNRVCYSHEYIGDGTRILKGQEPKEEQTPFF